MWRFTGDASILAGMQIVMCSSLGLNQNCLAMNTSYPLFKPKPHGQDPKDGLRVSWPLGVFASPPNVATSFLHLSLSLVCLIGLLGKVPHPACQGC